MGLVGEMEEGRERRERVVSHFAFIHETTALNVVLCRELGTVFCPTGALLDIA